MCYTISVSNKAKAAIKEYVNSHKGVQLNISFEENFHLVNGFSHPQLPIIRKDSIDIAEWGLIPSFVVDEGKADEIKKMTLNARNDTIFQKPSFKQAVVNQRCVLVVDGFFEWRHENGVKYPFYIYPKDGGVFYLGCIYNNWINRYSGEVRDTFSIITTEANELMEYIHNTKKRMPLIIHSSEIAEWIDPDTPKDRVKKMMIAYPQSDMSYHNVTKDAGNGRLDRNKEDIKKEVIYEELSKFVPKNSE